MNENENRGGRELSRETWLDVYALVCVLKEGEVWQNMRAIHHRRANSSTKTACYYGESRALLETS